MMTHDDKAVQESEEEARRLVRLLARLVKLSGRSMRSIEAELGLGSSVVSKFFAGAIRPQLSYVLLIAKVIGVMPKDFFTLAYPPTKEKTGLSPLVEQMLEAEALSPKEEPAEPEVALEDQVALLVRRELQRMLQTG